MMQEGFWKKKTVTILIIPSATQTTRRITLPHFFITGIWLFFMVVISTICALVLFMNNTIRSTDLILQQQYEQQQKILTTEISTKDNRLTELESILYDLTSQTNEFKSKLENLKQLKNVVGLMDDSDNNLYNLVFNDSISSNKNIGGNVVNESHLELDKVAKKARDEMIVITSNLNDIISKLEIKENDLKSDAILKASQPTIWPTTSNEITSMFGYRKDPFSLKPSFHSGVDIEGEFSDDIYATADGKVSITGNEIEKGNYILIVHSNSVSTMYMHLSKISVKAGETVKKGQKIGFMGSTGRSTGTHLHYEVLINNSAVNPVPYLIDKIKN